MTGKIRREKKERLGCVDFPYKVSITEQASCQKVRNLQAVFDSE